MHRIIVIPIAAPDKAVFFKDTYNLNWNLVLPFWFALPFSAQRQ